MSTGGSDPPRPVAVPLSHVMLVLVGVPALYIANSLLPWSLGLLRRHDHAFFIAFWTSIAVLHWTSVALVIVLLKRARRGLADIGLDVSRVGIAVTVGVPIAIGLTFVMLREAGISSESTSQPSAVVPTTVGEAFFWIFISFTAAFCEEVIYRGFGIRVLQARKMATWLAVGLATLAFVVMHGITAMAPAPFLLIYVAGVLFSALFLWRRSLVPGICLHALVDLAAIVSP